MKKGQAYEILGFIGLVVIILFVISIPFSIRIIDETEVGVEKVLGKVKHDELGAGIHFVKPLITTVHKFPVYESTLEMVDGNSVHALTNEGLDVTYELAVQWAVEPNQASEMYSEIKEPIPWMISRVRSKARDITAEYTVEDLYTNKRAEIQMKFERDLQSQFEQKGINIKAVLIRDVKLPDRVVERIEEKIQAKQDAEKMEFIIQKEELEADRKEIEARGIATANRIIANSLTKNYLTWYWIGELDQHESVIYVPIDSGGLPIFKDVDNLPNTNTTR